MQPAPEIDRLNPQSRAAVENRQTHAHLTKRTEEP